ncbi:transglutaminase family protein [Candidatus Sulfidibacterium hydrothermale]|uniref:transglutaminase-like domain-containing protein n=1 Tax=Candidatus Sulfidibacterium hydrothermale TaxID=2875962 RepID=UPI001F0AE077|nr:transglutaminase family protein [Candidatus Sulfidibacterium hydrothermale]UBM62258.1 transglutaminase family protein [Candidatus Sulfidibacterium hydrothermale]
MDKFLQPTPFLNFEHPVVQDFVRKTTEGISGQKEKAVRLFYAIRDGIRYNPYHIDLTVEGMRASTTLQHGYGWCVGKAVLLTTVCRAAGIPARLGFADVRNHLSPGEIVKALKTDIFYWHGFSLLFLDGKWVKATPAFDLNLCEKHNIFPVEFNGEEDAVFPPYDRSGNRHIEYLNDRGVFDDLPLQQIYESYKADYGEDVLEILLSENHPVKMKIRQAEQSSR